MTKKRSKFAKGGPIRKTMIGPPPGGWVTKEGTEAKAVVVGSVEEDGVPKDDDRYVPTDEFWSNLKASGGLGRGLGAAPVFTILDETHVWGAEQQHMLNQMYSPEEVGQINAALAGPWAPKLEDDPVNHPAHYTTGKIECADYIADKEFDFFLGNVVKYVTRCAHKGSEVEDLKKAAWYLNRAIELRS